MFPRKVNILAIHCVGTIIGYFQVTEGAMNHLICDFLLLCAILINYEYCLLSVGGVSRRLEEVQKLREEQEKRQQRDAKFAAVRQRVSGRASSKHV